ncbi:MAG: DUF998 domain-containing protein [Rhodanobacteraceae bacterium]
MIATALGIVAGIYLAIGTVLLARRRPEYSHLRNTISELGETGARDQRLVAAGLFLPVGVVLLLAASLLRFPSPAGSMLALAIAIGYVGAALFPCDPGSPLSGTWRQTLHNFAGGIEYIGGGFALVTLARDFGLPFQIAGFVAIGAAIALSVLPSTGSRGAIQRVAELCLFGGLARAAGLVAA